jgi:Tol biopolymer transport system component
VVGTGMNHTSSNGERTNNRASVLTRALFLMILLALGVSLVMAQRPARKIAPKHYRVAADEAPRRVTRDGGYPSPDGKLTAYASSSTISPGPGWSVWTEDPHYELRVVATDGSDPRVLYKNRDAVALSIHGWSPNGEYVAAMVVRKDRIAQLFLVSVADASVRVLKTQMLKTLNLSFQWHNMSFSPDGYFVAYDLSPQGGWHPRDIFLIRVEGGPEIPLVQHPANDVLLGWTPDGRGVLFASDRSGQWDLWYIEVFAGHRRGFPKLVKPNFGSIMDDGLDFTALGFKGDGSFYYELRVFETELYVATLDAEKNRLGVPAKLASRVGRWTSPDWSRDGRYLAYAWGLGSPYDPVILGIRSDQSGEERQLRLDGLIAHGGHAVEPSWSPDGRFLLVDARERDYAGPLLDSQGLYRIDVQTGRATPLVQTNGAIAGIDSPIWSSDSNVIFERRPSIGDRSRIVMRDVETGKETDLYDTVPPAVVRHFPTGSLAASPNDQRLAFVWMDKENYFEIKKGQTTALMVLPTGGGETRELLRTQAPVVISAPAWTPDSRHIIYARLVWLGPFASTFGVAGDKPKFDLWRIPAEGGEPQNLGLVMEGLQPYGLSVHPDGKRIAFTAGNVREEYWVLKDFLPMRKTAR